MERFWYIRYIWIRKFNEWNACYFWFDEKCFFCLLIGHTFLLIWNNLFIVEEGKAYLGWERIKDMLRNEEHKRLSTDLINPAGDSDSRTALSKLKVLIITSVSGAFHIFTWKPTFVLFLVVFMVLYIFFKSFTFF